MKEAGVIIAISSPHRKESLEAVSFAIDKLKAEVPIWKKVRKIEKKLDSQANTNE